MNAGHTPMRSILEQARIDGWREGLSFARQVDSDDDYLRGRHDGLMLHAAWVRRCVIVALVVGIIIGRVL